MTYSALQHHKTHLIENERAESEAADNDSVHKTLLSWEPPHGRSKWRNISEGGSQSEHEAISDRG